MTKSIIEKKLYEFLKSAYELSEEWEREGDRTLEKNYPFKKSFNEVCNDIQIWYETYKED